MHFTTSCPSLLQQRSESNKSQSALIGQENIFHSPKEHFNPSNLLFKSRSKLLLEELAKTVLTAEKMFGAGVGSTDTWWVSSF